MPPKRTTKRTTEEVIEGELTPVTEPERTTDFPTVFGDYLDAHANPERTFSIALFEVVGASGNAPDISYLANYAGRVPPHDEVALTFGPGKYKMILHYVKKGERSTQSSAAVVFSISTRYRPVNGQGSDPGSPTVPAPIPGYSPGMYPPPDNAALLGLVKHFMTVVKDIATARGATPAGGGIADFKSMSDAMGEIMIQNARTQQRLVDQLVLERAGLEDEPAEQEPHSLTQWVLWVWRNFGTSILSGTKAIQELARQKVAAAPQWDQLRADPELFAATYSELVKEAGPENVGRLLDILGIQRPESQSVSPDASPGAPAEQPRTGPQASGR